MSTVPKKPTVGSIYKFAGIDWRVLALENDKALLISEKILVRSQYNAEEEDITWENCTLRKYLNGRFLDDLGAIKPAIVDMRNNNPDNPWYGVAGGNATTDKVFLLNLCEIVKYYGDSGDLANKRRKDREGNPNSSGFYVHDRYNNARMVMNAIKWESWCWLRSPGETGYKAACIGSAGDLIVGGINVTGAGGVRPALWLNL